MYKLQIRILLIGLYCSVGLYSCAHKTESAKECVGPKIEYNKAYLLQCKRDDLVTCCAYGLVSPDGTLCYHILCQPLDDCFAPWEYIGTECPPPPERVDNGQEADKSKAEGTQG